MVTKEVVIEKLKQIYDPEIPVDIYNLGLIYRIEIEGNKINITMTLTAPGCPLAGTIAQEVENRLKELEGVEEVNVEIVWEPQWTIDRLTEEGKKKLREFGYNI